MTDQDEQGYLNIIHEQEIAITELTNRLRARDDLMQQAIHEADALHKSLSSTYLRMLNSRMSRVKC